MRILVRWITVWRLPALGLAVAWLTQAAFADISPEDLPQAAWFWQFQRELRAAWVSPDLATHGKVRFVVGNDLVQPGRQFDSGNEWLALVCAVDGCRLTPAILDVKKAVQQGASGATTSGQQLLHFRLRGPSEAKVVAWLETSKAPAWLTAGPVPTYYNGSAPPRETGKGTLEALIDLPGGATASLVPLLLTRPDDTGRLPPMLLQLRAMGKRQLLLGQLGLCSRTLEDTSYLLWAGDIDRDGKPDYLISFVDADGPVHLYLSSEAKPGQLVGLAGLYNSPPSSVQCDASEDNKD